MTVGGRLRMTDTKSQRLPSPLLGATLVAFAALYASGGRFVGLWLLAIALIGTFLTSRRLPPSPALAWVLRVVIDTIIVLAAAPTKFVSGSLLGGSVLYEPQYTQLFGYLCAAELVLRAWIRRAGGPSRGEMIVLSSLVLMVATNTYERRWIAIHAPV
jgi:hypothetical protein